MQPHFEAATLDDLLRTVLEQLLESGEASHPTKGATSELFGCALELSDPRARLSRSANRGRIFSALGELLWYLSGSDSVEPIEYYIKGYKDFAEDSGSVRGAYGTRLFNFGGIDQVSAVIERLRTTPDSRKAVVQIFDRSDIQDRYKDVPCTCTIQFLIRGTRLQMVTYMRSNDAYLGLPHDIFAFTMLQEIVARSLDIEVGKYIHMVGSLHLYQKNKEAAVSYLNEGWQPSLPVMQPMPVGDPWPHIRHLLAVEHQIRLCAIDSIDPESFEASYWRDIGLLLEAYTHRADLDRLSQISQRLSCSDFRPYLRERIEAQTNDTSW